MYVKCINQLKSHRRLRRNGSIHGFSVHLASNLALYVGGFGVEKCSEHGFQRIKGYNGSLFGVSQPNPALEYCINS